MKKKTTSQLAAIIHAGVECMEHNDVDRAMQLLAEIPPSQRAKVQRALKEAIEYIHHQS